MPRLLCSSPGSRLDVFLAQSAPDLSRSRAQKLIAEGLVRVNGAKARASHVLEAGDEIEYEIPSPRPTDLRAENLPLRILHEDEDLIVLDKAAGVVVHPGAGNWSGTLVNALLHHSGGKLASVGGELRPGIVHRIDKNTSGVLVVTKSDRAHAGLAQQFKEHSIDRAYWGVAWGKLPPQGEWNEALGRDPKHRQRMAARPDGKRAVTRFTLKESLSDGLASFFEAQLLTGRTHQIRAHFAHHSFPLLGDATYTAANRTCLQKRQVAMAKLQKRAPDLGALIEAIFTENRQFLHAIRLGFAHPISGKRLEFTAPMPEELEKILAGLRQIR